MLKVFLFVDSFTDNCATISTVIPDSAQ